MNTWISLLPLELDAMTLEQIIEPLDGFLPGDKELGIMPETARKLYTLGKLIEREAGIKHLDSQLISDQDARLNLEAQAFELGSKGSLLKDLMWIDIRDELKLWQYANIGIRRGFKVVHSKSNPVIRMFGFGGELP